MRVVRFACLDSAARDKGSCTEGPRGCLVFYRSQDIVAQDLFRLRIHGGLITCRCQLGWLPWCALGPDPNVDCIVGGIAQVLDLVLERREPSRLPGVCVYLLGFSILISEPEVSAGENHNNAPGVVMHCRHLVRAIM